MVDITCTRCGASGTDYPTNYVAKLTLTHNRGCGPKIGIPKFGTTVSKAILTETPLPEPTEEKPKKKKAKKTSKKLTFE